MLIQRRITLAALVSSLVVITACERPDATPISIVLGTAAPLGYLAAKAVTAVEGAPASCVTLAAPCDVFPCVADLEVDVSDACPLPIGDGMSGRVAVTGAWSDASNAVLAVDVSSIDGLHFEGALGLIVDVDEGRVNVIWAMDGRDVDEEDETEVSQSAITIRVEREDLTTDDDDTIEVNGAQQVIHDDVITQVTVTSALFTTACRANPISGEAIMQRVDSEDVDATVVALEFHEACDGRADPLVGAGEIPFIDDTTPLSLTE